MLWLQNYLAAAAQPAASSIATAQVSALANYLNPYAAPAPNVTPQGDLSHLIREAALFLSNANPNSTPAAPSESNFWSQPSESVPSSSLYDEFEPARKKPKMMEEISPQDHAQRGSADDFQPTLRPPAEPVVDLVNFPDYKDVLKDLGLGKHLPDSAVNPAPKPKIDAPKPKSILKSTTQATSITPTVPTTTAKAPAQPPLSASSSSAVEDSKTSSNATSSSSPTQSVSLAPPKPAVSAPPSSTPKAAPPPVSGPSVSKSQPVQAAAPQKQPVEAPKQPPKQPAAFGLSNLLSGVPPKAPAKVAAPSKPKSTAPTFSMKNVDARVAAAQAPHPMALQRPIVAYVHGCKVGVNLRQKAADMFFAEYLKRFGENQKLKAVNAALKYELRAYHAFPKETIYRVQCAHLLKALRDGTEKRTESDEEMDD